MENTHIHTHGIVFVVIGFSEWCSGKESSYQYRRCRFNPWVRKIPWSRKWQPNPVFLTQKFHGQRSLAVYSPWDREELDMAEHEHCCLVAKAWYTPLSCHGLTLQAPMSMGFPRQEYWSGLPFPSPGDLPNLGMEPVSPPLAGRFFTTEPLGKPQIRGVEVYKTWLLSLRIPQPSKPML